MNISTKVIHVGGEPDKETGAIMPPIFQTSTYVRESPGAHKGYEYSRSHNPTRTRLEENLASLEGAKHALVTSSGLSCITLMINALPPRSNIICGDDVYTGTHRLFTSVLSHVHNITFVDTTDLKALEVALKETKASVIWLETPTNPMLKIADISKIATLAKKYKAKTYVDNTFMSPYFQNPIALGADVVVHSLTKYINGHSDVIGGCMMTSNKSIYENAWQLQRSTGPCASPFDSWLVLRGIKTLAVRMEAHQLNAIKIAHFLESHPNIESVLYPGLKSHPQHKLAKKQMDGFGGMITFFLKGGLSESKKFISKLKLFKLAESLGGVESLINHPSIMTCGGTSKNIRQELGIKDNLVRLSVGIEHTDDLIADLEKALSSLN